MLEESSIHIYRGDAPSSSGQASVSVTPPKDNSPSDNYRITTDSSPKDLKKLTVKLSRITPDQITDLIHSPKKELITSSKFYSKSKVDVEPVHTPVYAETNSRNDSSSKKDSKKRIPEKTVSKNLFVTSTLPDDFTPELISQLAADGCDLAGVLTGRKSRNLIKQQLPRKAAPESSSGSSEDEPETNNKIFKSRNEPRSINNPNNKEKLKVDLSEPNENPSFKRFTQTLEDLVEAYEQDMIGQSGDDQIDSDITNILTPKICTDLVQEAFKLNSYSIMYLARKEHLIKLQNLLYFSIKDGINSLQLVNEDASDNLEQEKYLRNLLIEKLLKASDCAIISLIIMTSNKMAKEVLIEDVIEQITQFTKLHLTETLFPSYDVVYKTSNDSKPSSKRKLVNQFNANSSSSSNSLLHGNKNKHMHHFYNKMREILSLLGKLVTITDLTDTIVITLSSLAVMCFFVENINELQLEALKVLTGIFTKYSKHRQLVLDDILGSLIKLNSGKRHAKLYKCHNGDSIQMFTALVLQLIQCEVSPIQQNDALFDLKESHLITAYEDASQTAKKFLSLFFSKCKTKQADSDLRPIFENFIQDLLVTVNKPEWPVSEIILNLLGIILVTQIQSESSDVGSRVNSLEYLGQIVSQLRKDSLEYQKNPEKVLQVLGKLSDKTIEINDKPNLFILQKSLISYLDSLESNDSALKYSKYFLLGQWLKELNQMTHEGNQEEHGADRVDKHNEIEEMRKNIYCLIEASDQVRSEQQNNILLDTNEAFILSKYLCSLKKTLDKNFDYYLVNILSLSGGASDSNTPTQVRSKAIKCLSLIIEADPQILLKQKVFACVQANFLHQTISVREASVDLIGRFITLKPELTHHYYKLLSDRILDVGVSVRKRAIKIFRDVCLNQSDFEHFSEICVKILRRINDEEAIKKLVIEMFYSIWFAPISGRELLLKRVFNIIDVVSELSPAAGNAQNTEIFEQLFNSLLATPNSAKEANLKEEPNVQISNEQEAQIARGKEVIKSCKQIVNCLIENVLNTEANASSPETYKRLVASFSTLHLLSKIKPENFVNHAEILLPYLNIKPTVIIKTKSLLICGLMKVFLFFLSVFVSQCFQKFYFILN